MMKKKSLEGTYEEGEDEDDRDKRKVHNVTLSLNRESIQASIEG